RVLSGSSFEQRVGNDEKVLGRENRLSTLNAEIFLANRDHARRNISTVNVERRSQRLNVKRRLKFRRRENDHILTLGGDRHTGSVVAAGNEGQVLGHFAKAAKRELRVGRVAAERFNV